MYCPNCGAFQEDDANFCLQCGAPLRKPENTGNYQNGGNLSNSPPMQNTFIPPAAQMGDPRGKKRRIGILIGVLSGLLVLGIGIAGIFVGLSFHSQNQFEEQLSLGEKYLRDLQYEDAVISLRQAIEIDPKREEPYLLLAQVYAAQEEYEDAVTVLEEGLEATGGSEEITSLLEEMESKVSSEPEKQEEKPGQENSSSAPSEEVVSPESAQASLERVDASVKNEEGQVILQWYYDKLVLEPDTPAFEEINRQAQELCAAYFENTDPGDTPLDTVDPEYPYMNLTAGEITYNQNGVISVRMDSSFYMGGVFNQDHYGVNFNLETGEKLQLTEVFTLEKDELLSYLQEQTFQYIDQNHDAPWWTGGDTDAKKVVGQYTLEEFAFYLEGDTVYLCYPTYTLGPGAMGSVVVPCPIR